MKLREDQVQARIRHFLDQEALAELRYFWLSFCDTERPAGQQFIGVCIVRARGITTAIQEAHCLGCNPGGEVQIYELPVGVSVDANEVGRLLTKNEALAIKLRREGRHE